ncbi:uncharacterized protein [Dermacentor albipictus]|uniref:uncharacterized protein isoform X2 n=1 Tax=Dermacentor albipictus TaxID=60249 RepID=UPI0031FC7CE6
MASCPLSMILVCACAALAGEYAAGRHIEVTPDGERAPLHDILFRQHSAPAPRQYGPIESQGFGKPCHNSSYCELDLCCRLDLRYERTCQPRSKIGDYCMLDSGTSRPYDYYCPCLEEGGR